MDPCIFADQIQLYTEIFCAVGYRFEVGHGAHGSVSAGCGSMGAGVNRFLIRKTRLTKMNMNINETRNDQTIIQFNNRSVFLRNRNNTTLVDRIVFIFKAAVGENGPAGQQQTHTDTFLLRIHSTYYTSGKRQDCQRDFQCPGGENIYG